MTNSAAQVSDAPASSTARIYQTLIVEPDPMATTVTINRPKALNALSELVLTELKALLVSMVDQPTYATRGLILTGAGDRAFIAGADIGEMAAMSPDESGNRPVPGMGCRLRHGVAVTQRTPRVRTAPDQLPFVLERRGGAGRNVRHAEHRAC